MHWHEKHEHKIYHYDDRDGTYMIEKFIREGGAWVRGMLRILPGSIGVRLRYRFYKKRMRKMGEGAYISTGCIIRGEKNIVLGDGVALGISNILYAGETEGEELIQIGDNTATNGNVMINADMGGNIRIGKYCLIGPNVVFRASNHRYDSKDVPIQKQGHVSGEIIVGDDVWIGANVVILPGAVIGDGAVIGAGSVVTGDIEPYSVCVGIPARKMAMRSA